LVARDLIAENCWKGSLVDWRTARESAERAARVLPVAGEEIALADIQAQLRAAVGERISARAVELELHHELEETIGISSTLSRIGELMAANQRVVYTSDMYLPIGHVKAMLAKGGAPSAPVFLSSELGMTKRSGRLFKYIAAHFKIPLADIRHTGDHRESDYRVPRRIAVKAMLFEESQPTPLESELYLTLSRGSPLMATTLAGAMRAARLSLPARPDDKEHLSRLGTQEGAVIHIAFALWIAWTLIAVKPAKIVFLARDGYLPMLLFDVLRQKIAAHLPESTYAYASRQALHLAGLKSKPRDEDLLWIMVPSSGLTFESWHFRLGLTRAEICAAVGEEREIPDADAPFSACKGLCAELLECEAFVGLALRKAREQRELATEYLAPLIAPEAQPTSLIDIGWNGRMQRSIVEILSLSEDDRRKIDGGYLGILRTPDGNIGRLSAWLFDLRNESRPYCASHFHLFETLFAAPHSTTYGYRRDDASGRVVPTLAPHDALSPLWPNLIKFHQVILGICANIRCDHAELTAAQPPLRVFARKTIVALFRAPEAHQARAFEGMSFSSDQTDLGKEKLIHDLTWSQQYRCFFGRKFKTSANHWREGQLAVADAPGLRWAYAFISIARLWLKGQWSIKDIIRHARSRLTRRYS
jgi:hypothetical protein